MSADSIYGIFVGGKSGRSSKNSLTAISRETRAGSHLNWIKKYKKHKKGKHVSNFEVLKQEINTCIILLLRITKKEVIKDYTHGTVVDIDDFAPLRKPASRYQTSGEDIRLVGRQMGLFSESIGTESLRDAIYDTLVARVQQPITNRQENNSSVLVTRPKHGIVPNKETQNEQKTVLALRDLLDYLLVCTDDLPYADSVLLRRLDKSLLVVGKYFEENKMAVVSKKPSIPINSLTRNNYSWSSDSRSSASGTSLRYRELLLQHVQATSGKADKSVLQAFGMARRANLFKNDDNNKTEKYGELVLKYARMNDSFIDNSNYVDI